VRLRLDAADGRPVSRNFYWLSAVPDVLDYRGGEDEWLWTPTKSHGDLRSLASLPEARLSVSAAPAAGAPAGEGALAVTVRNESDHLAFQVRLRLTDGEGGPDVRPVFWEDNYFELAPRETREIRVTHPLDGVKAPAVSFDGWNVKPSGG
jgi:exo-1,4-beta-D-glucosaminidase